MGGNADKMVWFTFRSSYRDTPRLASPRGKRASQAPSLLVIVSRRCDLSSEHGQVDHGVEQHEREHEETRSPEHEGKARVRCGRLFDRDREWDHVGPERDRQSAEGRDENQSDHGEGPRVLTAMNAGGKHDGS